MIFDLHALADGSRVLLQGGLLLLIVSTPLLGVALVLARNLRRKGNPSLAAVVLRASLVCLIAAPFLLPLGYLAPSGESGDAFFAQRQQSPDPSSITAPPSAIALSTATYAASHSQAEPIDFSSWYIAGAGAWLSVSLLLLTGLGCSHAYLRMLRRNAVPVSPESDAAHAFAVVTRASEAPTVLLTHPRVTVPFAVAGMFGRPGTIFLPPQDAPSTALPENTLPAVLAHEQAHLRRGDFGWNLTARIVGALLWPQPLLYVLLRHLEAAQELACDREALAATRFTTCRPHDYADSLVAFAERHFSPSPARTTGTAAVSHRSLLEERIHRIMEDDRTGNTPAKRRTRLLLATSAAIALGTTTGGLRQLAPFTAALPLVPAPTMAQARAVVDSPPTKSDPFGGKQANVDFRDTDIEEAFRSVLASNGYTLRFTPEARACIQGFVTMKCTGYSLNDVLALIVRSCSTPSSAYRLRWSVENNIVTFRVAELNADGLPNKRVTLNYPDRTPLQTVLEDLAAGTDIKFRLAPPPAGPNILPGSASFPPSVTTRVRENNVSFKTALDDVLRRASRTYTYRIHSFGVVTITDVEAARADAERRAAEQAALEAERAKAAHARAAEASNLEYVIFVGDPIPDKRITIDFKTAPFRTALEQVFNTARVDWSLDNNVQGSAVTLQYQDAPLSTVLAAILKQSSTPITCANSNGVLIIRPRVAP